MRSRPSDRGSVAVEAAVIAPALVLLLLLVVFAGRVSHLDAAVQRASSEASRAASLQASPDSASEAAYTVASANLASNAVPCTELAVDTDTSNFRPGGSVTIEIRCTASMSDVALLGVPGHRMFTAVSTEVVDRFRGNRGEG